jgi:hypothetical protein
MALKELLKSDFGVDLPISGGFGNSIDNPIIIHSTDLNDYVGTEKLILNCLGKGREIEWRILKQEILSHSEKKFDKIKIETIQTTDSEIITQIENYYFDITDCVRNSRSRGNSFNEKEILEKIKKRMIQLERLNDFNKNCINLLKNEELFKDTKLTVAFLDVILNDESLPLFESMMNNKRKPIMETLRIIGKDLK